MNLTTAELHQLLDSLRRQHAENEVVEFKEAKNDFSFDKIGMYFSALANEANLKNTEYAWLIFGIEDKHHAVVGSHYRSTREDLDLLKHQIAEQTTSRTSFIEIYELQVEEKRVLMFQIPASPHGVPIAYKGHYYAREGESLVALSLEKIERIRMQGIREDWSAVVVREATASDLDPLAISKARENYSLKFPDVSEEARSWDTTTFLNKAKLTIRGGITRTALLLLGKEEAEHLLSPADARIRWVLKDLNNQEKDYETFSIPFLLAVDKVHLRIRNLKYRYIKEGTLFPEEVLKYEPFVIREALNNCIAHQDYEKGGRINVVEIEDEQLIFTNLGDFLPGSVERVVMDDSPAEVYRNQFLVNAMFGLKMVDTAGGGIKKMFNFQRQRYFPMPDYDLRNGRVKVTIIGKVLDVEFARVLANSPALGLNEIIMLDKVQKKKSLTKEEARHLRSLKLIEGRKPNYFISSNVVSSITNVDLKTQYVKQRPFDDAHYRDMIIAYIEQYGSASRKEIDSLLLSKLSDVLDEKQKANKISNLLGWLRIHGIIKNCGSAKKPRYVIIDK